MLCRMGVIRQTALLLAVISLVSSADAVAAYVPALDSGANHSALHGAAAGSETSAGPIEVGDATLSSEPAVELSGEILAVSSQLGDGVGLSGMSEGISYAVQTVGGLVVPVSADFPDGVVTGDLFEGVVTVSSTLLPALSESAVAAVTASAGDIPVEEGTDAAAEVHEAAAESTAELPVMHARITGSAQKSVPGAAAHELVLLVNSPPSTAPVSLSDAAVLDLGARAASFWASSSRGKISQFAVHPQVVRTAAGNCAEDPWLTWNRGAQSLGYLSWADFRASSPAGVARHLIVLQPRGCAASAGSGVGIVGSQLHYGGATRQVVGDQLDLTTLVHELGHNLSLGHANLDVCDGASCSSHEYWDLYDVMGVGVRGYDVPTAISSPGATRLGFMSPATEMLASGQATRTVNSSLTRLDASTGTRSIAVIDPISGEKIFIELRGSGLVPRPYYDTTPSPTLGGRTVVSGPGVRMVRTVDNGSAVIANGTIAGAYRSAIGVGQTMKSPTGGITVRVVSGSVASTVQVEIAFSSAGQSAPPSAPPTSSPPSANTVGTGAVAVKGPQGERLPGATIEVRQGSCTGPAVWRTTTTDRIDAYGAFGVSLTTGSYCVIPLAAPPGYNVAGASTFRVTVGAGNWHTVWLPSLVSGAVAAKSATGEPINGVSVLISRGVCSATVQDVWAQTTSTNRWSTGSFGIALAPGSYCVKTTSVPKGFAKPGPRNFAVQYPGPAWVTVWLPRASL